MRSIIGNKLASLYNLQSKTQCVGFFTRTYKTKYTKDWSLLFGDRKKVSVSILYQKVCLGWNLSPIINRLGGVGGGGGIRMSWGEKNRKIN